MRRNLEWNQGAPEKLEPGMAIITDNGLIRLIGDGEFWCEKVAKWAWVIKPHELEWAADIAGKHANGRLEQ